MYAARVVLLQTQRLNPNQAVPFLTRAFVTHELGMSDSLTNKGVRVKVYE